MTPPRIAVVGGSVGGLSAGVALHAAGFEVDVHERQGESPSSRGAGIVVQPELLRLVERIGSARLPTTSCSHRRTVNADGDTLSRQAMPQRFTSWEAIHRALRASYPIERHHAGVDVREIREVDGRVQLHPDPGSASAHDVVVLADGARSRLRETLGFETVRSYAGYVAWRGTVAESDLSASLIDHFDDAFVFCDARDGGHALAYFIPGDGASVEAGTRRLNWVWYESVAEGERLDTVLTDATGRLRTASIPPGAMRPAASAALRAKASRLLDPRLAAAIGATPGPFVQAIEDQASSSMVRGRTALLGDAAFVIRPHTAGAAAKAAGDAMALADALRHHPGDVDAALQAYQARRLPVGLSLTGYGVALGRRSVTP